MEKILLHNSEEICHIKEKRLAICEQSFYNKDNRYRTDVRISAEENEMMDDKTKDTNTLDKKELRFPAGFLTLIDRMEERQDVEKGVDCLLTLLEEGSKYIRDYF